MLCSVLTECSFLFVNRMRVLFCVWMVCSVLCVKVMFCSVCKGHVLFCVRTACIADAVCKPMYWKLFWWRVTQIIMRVYSMRGYLWVFAQIFLSRVGSVRCERVNEGWELSVSDTYVSAIHISSSLQGYRTGTFTHTRTVD